MSAPLQTDPSLQPIGPTLPADSLRMKWRLAWIGVCVLAVAIFIPALFGPMVWDDHELLTGAGIGNAQSVWDCFNRPFLFHYYRPVTSISFLIDRRLWGEAPFGYHLTNLTLHVVTVGALIGLLLAAFRSRRIAILGGVLFAVQPVQVSTTAWIGGRTDVLCTLLLVLYVWSLVAAAKRTDGQWKLLMAASIAFAAAILAKEQALPAILLAPLALWIFSQNHETRKLRSIGKFILPFAVIAVLYLTSWSVWGPRPPHPAPVASAAYVAAVGQSILYYFLVLFAPTVRWMHTFSLESLQGTTAALVGFLLAAGALACLRSTWRKSKEAAWFLLFAALAIVPAINVIPIASLPAAPYRAGLAGAASAALLAWFLARQSGLLEAAPTNRAFVWKVAGGAHILWMAGLTTWGVLPWRNEIEISSLAMHYNPGSLFARLELTSALLDAGQAGEAERLLRRTIRISTSAAPSMASGGADVVVAPSSLGDNTAWIVKLYTRVGLARLKEPNFPDAADALRTAIALAPMDAFANVGMANYAYQTGDWKGAAENLRIALITAPQMTQKHMARGQILFQHEQWTDAQAEFAVCVSQQPKVAAPYVALADAQKKGGDDDDARATLELAVSRGVITAQEAKDRLAMGTP